MELQNIRENRQAAQRSQDEMTPIEREIEADRETWLERVNIHLEKLLEKEKKENNMLRKKRKITCSGTWRTIIGHEIMFAKQGSRSWKQD